jgi:hypothetical protein
MLYILLVLVGSFASAVEGQFSYNGDFNVVSSMRNETVYPASKSGQERLNILRNEGYSCQNKLQFVQCQKVFTNAALPESMANVAPTAQYVSFENLLSLELISKGDDVSIYEAQQNIIVDGVSYSNAQYLERSDLVKVTVGDLNHSDYHSFIVYTDMVSLLDSFNHTESKWVYTTYLIEFFLKKQIQ